MRHLETVESSVVTKYSEGPPLVVVGVPAFNEEKSIGRVVLEARKHADKIIVCDDGSNDLTGEIAKELGAVVVRHRRNLGYGAAIQTLFKRARKLNADVLVTLDGDGQHDPSEIPDVVKPILGGHADIVIGSRFADGHPAAAMPWYRRAGVKFITKLVNNSSEHTVNDAQSGFRAYSRESLEALKVFENGMGASVEILMNAQKQGFRILEVASSVSYHNEGVKTSTHNPVKHGVGVVMSIAKLVVEGKPLILLGLPGIIFLMAGAAFGVWMLQAYVAEHRIMTNIALASMAFIMIGFFCLSTSITLYAISRFARKTNNK
jgi:glycosyltransferase involved in cell wall biosynthesis